MNESVIFFCLIHLTLSQNFLYKNQQKLAKKKKKEEKKEEKNSCTWFRLDNAGKLQS